MWDLTVRYETADTLLLRKILDPDRNPQHKALLRNSRVLGEWRGAPHAGCICSMLVNEMRGMLNVVCAHLCSAAYCVVHLLALQLHIALGPHIAYPD